MIFDISKSGEVEDVSVAIEATDEDGEVSELDPYNVNMDELEDDFIQALLEKVITN